jgi:hypothetical protein
MMEIPATGSLLLLNSEMTAYVREQLGMLPYVHYLPYTRDTLDAVVDAVLDADNRPAIDAIRRQGQQLVWARHMVHHRANTLHTWATYAAGYGAGTGAGSVLVPPPFEAGQLTAPRRAAAPKGLAGGVAAVPA